MVSDGTRAYDACRLIAPLLHPTKLPGRWLAKKSSPAQLDPFLVMTAEGSYSTPHVDPNGYCTLLNMVRGTKVVFIACPRHAMVPMMPHFHHVDSTIFLEGPELDFYLVALRKNQTMCVNFCPID